MYDQKEDLAFEFDQSGYHFKAVYLDGPECDSRIEISKDGQLVKSFLWPSYKIWNIPAHASDIVANLEEGLKIAGSDGLGGNVYQE